MSISLKEKYKDYFKIGAAVNPWSIKKHEEILIKHFNSLTCENEMKFQSVCPKEGEYDFSRADLVYDFALKNDMDVRGHTFVWHNQSPKWVFENADRDILLDRMKNHINTIAARYGRIYSWDVVNEVIDDKHGEYLRDTKWLSIIGEDYIEKAFLYAKEAAPKARLVYNDYNEAHKDKREKMCRLVKGLLDKGIPIDGVGLQCHWNIFFPEPDTMKETIEQIAQLGLKIHVTEMDVSMFAFEDHNKVEKPTDEMISKQAKLYGEAFKIFREYKEQLESVTLWGVADDMTWLDNFPVRNRKNWPLLFDENHQPKEAVNMIMDF